MIRFFVLTVRSVRSLDTGAYVSTIVYQMLIVFIELSTTLTVKIALSLTRNPGGLHDFTPFLLEKSTTVSTVTLLAAAMLDAYKRIFFLFLSDTGRDSQIRWKTLQTSHFLKQT